MTGYKIDLKKNQATSYIKWSEKEIRKTSFTTASNKFKYNGVSLSKQVKDLYNKNLKSLKKEMEMILEDKKISHAHLVGLDNIVQMAILPKAIYRFNKIPIKSLMWFFIDLERIILNFIWKMDKNWIPKMILNNKKLLEVSPSLISSHTTEIK